MRVGFSRLATDSSVGRKSWCALRRTTSCSSACIPPIRQRQAVADHAGGAKAVAPTNGFPCIHNVKHAQLIGMDPDDLLHYKDTTAAWREQYDADFVFPTLSSEDIDDDKINTDYVYPPIPPPKVGRPKKAVRMKGSKEKARKRKYSLPICGACGNAGHIASNKECPNRKQGASGGRQRKR